MSMTIQMLYLIKRKEAWYQLSEADRDLLSQQTLEVTKRAGGQRIILCDTSWSTGDCEFFELAEFADLSAVQKRIELYEEVNLFRYFEISTLLGSPMGLQSHAPLEEG